MFVLFLVMMLNFGISIWNASVVGRYWSEKKQLPTWSQVVLWAGAVMSVCGFFIVYLVLVTMVMQETHGFEFFASLWKVTLEPADIEMLVQNIFDLGYLMCIFFVIGSGLIIMVHSWMVAYVRRDFLSYGVAGYNTGANLYNVVRATRHVPQAVGSLAKGFGRMRLRGKGAAGLVLFLMFLLPIVISLTGAIVTTVLIMHASDTKWELDDLAKEGLQ